MPRSLPRVGLRNDGSLADQTGTSLGVGMVKHTGAAVAHPELEVMPPHWQWFSAGSCLADLKPSRSSVFLWTSTWLSEEMLAAEYPCSCVWEAANALTLFPCLPVPSEEDLDPVFRSWLCLVTTQGCLLWSWKDESTQSPRGCDKPHLQFRDETGTRIYHHAHKTCTSCNSAKFHKCTVTQWLHLEAISVRST